MRLDNIDNEKFEKILLYKRPVLFTPLRIKHDAVPEGLYKYEVRHDDECTGEIVEIAHGISYGIRKTMYPSSICTPG
jgi:hypothetical protein